MHTQRSGQVLRHGVAFTVGALVTAALLAAGCGGDPAGPVDTAATSDPAAPAAVTAPVVSSPLVGKWITPAGGGNLATDPGRYWAFRADGTFTYHNAPSGTPDQVGPYSIAGNIVTIADGSPTGFALAWQVVTCTDQIPHGAGVTDCLILSAMPYYRAE